MIGFLKSLWLRIAPEPYRRCNTPEDWRRFVINVESKTPGLRRERYLMNSLTEWAETEDQSESSYQQELKEL